MVPSVSLSERGRSGHARHALAQRRQGLHGIPELEYAPNTTDAVESGFAHLDRATRTLFGAGIDSCIAVAHASMMGAFHTAGARQQSAKASVKKHDRATGGSSTGKALDMEEVESKVEEFEMKSYFKVSEKERSEIIQYIQWQYQQAVLVESRDALKAESVARLERLQSKKDDPVVRLCSSRCVKYNEFIKITPCRYEADLRALVAAHGNNSKACAEALRDQVRLREHVYKVRSPGVINGSDKPEGAIVRLMATLPALVAKPLPKQPPPAPVPYPTRTPHPAPTSTAVAFELKHLASINAAITEVMATTNAGSF